MSFGERESTVNAKKECELELVGTADSEEDRDYSGQQLQFLEHAVLSMHITITTLS